MCPVKAPVRLLAVCAVTLWAALPASAGAAETSSAPAAPPAAETPTPPVVPPPSAGKIKLELERVAGTPLFALMGTRIVVHGLVTPYVAGQTVKVSFYREGRKVEVRIVSVLALHNGEGQFRINFATRTAGLVQALAVHYATPQQVQFSGRSPRFRFVFGNVGPGSQGQSVQLLQSELSVLHYAVPLNGVFEEATGRALIAFRKVTGLEPVPSAGGGVFERLAHGAGSFHVHYPGDGRHVEADLTRQVLAEIDRGGHVRAIFTMSSGKPSTPTVIGRFQVYRKEPGTNSHGMVDSSYFISGYAIHGYAEVPTFAASHGCLRIPIPDAAAIYGWVQFNTPVDVYNENGRGSHTVRSNAGP
jgi:peptidoglycan hydrolase-like protein with peptidoglycan-binding domain